jgi:hypothetical protein
MYPKSSIFLIVKVVGSERFPPQESREVPTFLVAFLRGLTGYGFKRVRLSDADNTLRHRPTKTRNIFDHLFVDIVQ